MKKILLYSFVIIVTMYGVSLGWTEDISDDEAYELYDDIVSGSHEVKETLSYPEISSLYYTLAYHPVAGLKHVAKYDTSNDVIGYSFGRAMAAHLIARRMGLAEKSIRKLFVIGYLNEEQIPRDERHHVKSKWRFHVTTLVKTENNKWAAIDPIMKRPLYIHQWIYNIRESFDYLHDANIYLTNASYVIPDIRFVPRITKEEGDGIIELTFDPEDWEGFTSQMVPGDRSDILYWVHPETAVDFFDDAHEEEGFNFLSLSVNHLKLSYKNYFVDLLLSLTDHSSAEEVPEEGTDILPHTERELRIEGLRNLRSMKLHRLSPNSR